MAKKKSWNTLVDEASKKVQAEITGQTDRSNKYSAGLAYEGWQGGYLAALRDVLLVMNGVTPSTRNYWEKE